MPRRNAPSSRSGRRISRDVDMAVDYETLMGFRVPDATQRYTARDTMLYALGIGMGADPTDSDQLRFVYENGLCAVPTQAFVLALPGAGGPYCGRDYAPLFHGPQPG